LDIWLETSLRLGHDRSTGRRKN
jgi:TonB dependent receptor.